MPTYSVLSGTRYTVRARDEEEAEAKLQSYWFGDDCPCGLPQWGRDEARRLEEGGELAGDWLCECVEKDEVDTDIQIVHADRHPDA